MMISFFKKITTQIRLLYNIARLAKLGINFDSPSFQKFSKMLVATPKSDYTHLGNQEFS